MNRRKPLAAAAASLVAIVIAVVSAALPARAETLTLVVLGDSLVAGYQLAPSDAFPARLEAALKARGHDVAVVNAGVSGDTATAGLERLDWSVGPEAGAVIVELGANDMLRGLDPDVPRAALDKIMARLEERGLPVLLAGMRAAPNLGPDYARRFDAIYPDLAARYDALLYPFFLDGVATVSGLNLADGMHPNPDGVGVIVERILPLVERLIERAR